MRIAYPTRFMIFVIILFIIISEIIEWIIHTLKN